MKSRGTDEIEGPRRNEGRGTGQRVDVRKGTRTDKRDEAHDNSMSSLSRLVGWWDGEKVKVTSESKRRTREMNAGYDG